MDLTDIGTGLVTEISVGDALEGKVVKVSVILLALRALSDTIAIQQYELGTNSTTIDNAIASVGGNE